MKKFITKNKVTLAVGMILVIWIVVSFIHEINLTPQIKEYDAITVYFYVVANSYFSLIQMLAPIFVMILASYQIHKEFHSGFTKYQLLRMDYKNYIKKKLLVLIKSTWILPAVALLMLILCYIFTGNFDFSNARPEVIGYTENGIAIMKSTISNITADFYDTPVQLMITYFLVLFLHSILYANLSFIMVLNNKNFLVTLLEAFLTFFAIAIVSELGLGIIAFKGLQLDFLSGIFNITGIWIYCDYSNLWAILVYSLILAIGSISVSAIKYKNKEKVLIACEK